MRKNWLFALVTVFIALVGVEVATRIVFMLRQAVSCGIWVGALSALKAESSPRWM